jgi:CheY-like chemotaxis protein
MQWSVGLASACQAGDGTGPLAGTDILLAVKMIVSTTGTFRIKSNPH